MSSRNTLCKPLFEISLSCLHFRKLVLLYIEFLVDRFFTFGTLNTSSYLFRPLLFLMINQLLNWFWFTYRSWVFWVFFLLSSIFVFPDFSSVFSWISVFFHLEFAEFLRCIDKYFSLHLASFQQFLLQIFFCPFSLSHTSITFIIHM